MNEVNNKSKNLLTDLELESKTFRETLLDDTDADQTALDKRLVKTVDNRFTAHLQRLQRTESLAQKNTEVIADILRVQTVVASQLAVIEPIAEEMKLLRRVIILLIAATPVAVAGFSLLTRFIL